LIVLAVSGLTVNISRSVAAPSKQKHEPALKGGAAIGDARAKPNDERLGAHVVRLLL
jgi:hypothetical protein